MSMNAETPEEGWSFREYATVLWGGRRLIVAVAVLAALAALGLALMQESIYEAEARVLVLPLESADPEGAPVAPNLETERQIMASEEVAQRVRDELQLDQDPAQLTGSLTVSVVPATEVLTVAFRADERDLVDDVANAFVREYLELRRERAIAERARVDDPVNALSERLRRLRGEMAELEQRTQRAQQRALRADGRAELRTYLVVLEHLLAQRTPLSQQIAEVRAALTEAGGGPHAEDDGAPLTAGRVVDPADQPSGPVSPNPLRNAIFAVAAGAAIGIVIVLLLHAMRAPARPD